MGTPFLSSRCSRYEYTYRTHLWNAFCKCTAVRPRRCGKHLLDANAVLTVDPPLELAVAVLELHSDSVVQNPASFPALHEVFLEDLGETPHTRGIDLLATSDLVLGTTQSLEGMLANSLAATDGAENLSDVHASNSAISLTEGTTHTGLKTISTGAGKHLVDTQDVERVHTDADVESILTGGLCHVLVASNAASLEGLGGDLLELVGCKVCREREIIDGGLLASEIVDTDLRVWDTTAVPRLDVRLVLLVTITFGRTATHA